MQLIYLIHPFLHRLLCRLAFELRQGAPARRPRLRYELRRAPKHCIVLALTLTTSFITMASFTTLPVELLLDIIQYLVPQNAKVPLTGVNASWKSLETFQNLFTPVPEWSLDKKRNVEDAVLPFAVPGSERFHEGLHPESFTFTDILALRL